MEDEPKHFIQTTLHYKAHKYERETMERLHAKKLASDNSSVGGTPTANEV